MIHKIRILPTGLGWYGNYWAWMRFEGMRARNHLRCRGVSDGSSSSWSVSYLRSLIKYCRRLPTTTSRT
ncbi:hypothetical protein RSAG8_10698, partial [Rhizoctonia solani AG-8 WAC10335]